jgi:hypothetical protein
MISPWEALVSTTKSADPLDDPEIWQDLIMGFVSLPMNYGADCTVCAIEPLALAAGLNPVRAAAKVMTYYHHHAPAYVLH